jgi:hypothetical protein
MHGRCQRQLMSKDFYIPGKLGKKVADRKERFAAINAYITEHGGGWLVSVPGDPDTRLQALPGSSLPDQLRKLGYIVERTG